MSGKILYLQYTNPAAYPPLEHSSHILAGAGWSVRFLGAAVREVDALELAPHPRIAVRTLPLAPSGWRQKAQYAGFLLRAVGDALAWRPRWVYASDLLSAPVALVLSFLPGVRVLYHEHDAPAAGGGAGLFTRLCLAARRRLARRADALVVPSAGRAAALSAGGAGARVQVVWNCPLREELRPARAPLRQPIRVLYHGSIVPERVPLSVLRAVASIGGPVELVLAGYVPSGAAGYVEELRAEAERLGISDRFRYVGPVPQRSDLLDLCATCDVGLALMPMSSDDVNLRSMAGASNKAFDYLACGLGLIVADLPDWRALFVEPELALAVDPESEESMARALRWYAENPERMRAMGEEGRRRVAAEWNYQAQFAPVLEVLSRPADTRRGEPRLAVTP